MGDSEPSDDEVCVYVCAIMCVYVHVCTCICVHS